MRTKTKHEVGGVNVSQYKADATDRCNFNQSDDTTEDSECGEPAVAALIVTDDKGVGVLMKLCRRHLCRLAISLI